MPRALTPLLDGGGLDERPPRPDPLLPPPCCGGSTVGVGLGDCVAALAAAEPADVRAHAGEGRATLVQPQRGSWRARPCTSRRASAWSSRPPPGPWPGPRARALVVSTVRSTSRSERASVRTMVRSVTSSLKSSAVNIASTAVTSPCLYIATARAASVARARRSSLYASRCCRWLALICAAHGLEGARSLRVLGDGRADLSVEAGDLGGQRTSRGAVLLERPRACARGCRSQDGDGQQRADREQSAERRTPYRVTV